MNAFFKRDGNILLLTVSGASRSVLLFLGLFILFALPSGYAIIDENSNLMSDVWERQYNQGELFTNLDPLGDLDNDGHPNAIESVAGTDPKTSQPPTGWLQPAIANTPAVYLSPAEEGGEPEILTPAAVTITWPTVAGKQYTQLSSTTLVAGSWQPVGEPIIGDGGETGSGITLTQPDGSTPPALFFRVAAIDIDTDGDTLTNAEEHALGTDPNAPTDPNDLDGDGLNNEEEALRGTNPNNKNTDGDSLDDGEDADPLEILVDWKRASESSYVLIEVDVPSEAGSARDINDKGEALFDTGIWAGGNWLAIAAPSQSSSFPNGDEPQEYDIDFDYWHSLNNDRSLLGWSSVTFTSGQAAGGDGVYTASTWLTGQSPYHLAEAIPFNFDSVLHMWPLGIDDTGRAFVRNNYREQNTSGVWEEKSRVAVISSGGESATFLTPSNDSFIMGQIGHSDVSGAGAIVCNTKSKPNPEDGSFSYQLAMWDSQLNQLPLPPEANGWYYPLHLTELPNGKTVLAGTKSGDGGGSVFLPQTQPPVIAAAPSNGSNSAGPLMLHVPSLSGKTIQMFAGDGTAITSDHKLWRNGKLIPLRELCPKLGELLDQGDQFYPLEANKHGTYLIKGADGDGNNEKTFIMVPVEIISDLNNDGKITAADNPLRDVAMASGADDATQDKGTEFIFHNDTLSNGIWDKEDIDPAKPATAKDDDDAEEITIKPGFTEGEVWLDHPAIAGLSFYKTRECKAEDKVNLSPSSKFRLSASNPFPDKLFMRADGAITYPEANPQFEGNLVLKIKIGTAGQEIEAAKMKLAIVKAVGAKKYFHTARDYMFENNSKLCIRKETVGNSASPSYKRLVSMLHEKTEMKAVDSFHRNPKLYGIDAVATSFPTYDVAVNGNFCFHSGLFSRPARNAMTDRCHGRLISSGVSQPCSSAGGSSPYESPISDFIKWNLQGGVSIGTGEVPATSPVGMEALGGFGSNIALYSWHPWFGIANTSDKKVIFNVMPYTIDSTGAGGGADLKNRLTASGCPPLPGGQTGEIQCIYGDGGSSLALAYKVAASGLTVKTKGEKHFIDTGAGFGRSRGDYFINTYLLFKSQNPR